jgi:hypothetical protein
MESINIIYVSTSRYLPQLLNFIEIFALLTVFTMYVFGRSEEIEIFLIDVILKKVTEQIRTIFMNRIHPGSDWGISLLDMV